MKNITFKIATFFIALGVLGLGGGVAFAQVWIHANGGSYWTQYGSNWGYISNQGYCVSGRGPCGSSLWYLQRTYNHSGCGFDEHASWRMASVQNYNGNTYAWIDSSTGNMYGADYSVVYNGGSVFYANVNQGGNYEGWVPIARGLYRTSKVWLTDGWSYYYICNGVGGLRVEFDEIKLEI